MKYVVQEASLTAPGQRLGSKAVENGLGASAWTGCSLTILALFAQLTAWGANGAFLSSLTSFADLVLATFLLGLFHKDLRGGYWADLLVPMVLLSAAASLTLLSRPLSTDSAEREILKLAGAAAVCLAGLLIGLRRRRVRLFMDMMVVVSGLYLLFCLMLRQIEPFTIFGQSKGAHMWRFSGTLLNANGAAVVFASLALIAAAQMLAALRKLPALGGQVANIVRLGGSGAVAFLAAGACALTGSRAGFAAMVLLGVALLLLDRVANGRSSGRMVWVLRTGMVLLLIVGLALGAGPLLGRSTAYDVDFAGRLQGYELYIRLLSQAPLTGWGLGAFPLLNQSHLDTANAVALWSFGSAHCAALQAAVEGGWPFLALIVSAGIFILFRVLSHWTQLYRSGAAPGLIAAFVLAVGSSFIDIALNIPAVAALTFLILGMLWGQALSLQRSLAS